MARFQGAIQSETPIGGLLIVEVDYRENLTLAAHAHGHPYVSVLVEGQYTEVAGNVPRRCYPGTIINHKGGETHSDYFIEPGRIANIELTCSALTEPATVLEQCLQTLDRLPRHIASTVANAAQIGLEDHVQRPGAPAWFEDTVRHFEWLSSRPLKDAARVAGVHPTHFTRAFRGYANLSPSGYRQRERVRAASRLLLESSTPLVSIAYNVGFSDQSHFTNAFRHATGLAPATFRRVFCR